MPSVDEQLRLLMRGVVYGDEGVARAMENELRERLAEGRPLRVYLGIDPTAPDLTLGHTVPMRKLRQFQQLGHEAVLLIGGFTALVGDPSDKESARPMLTLEEIEANGRTYAEQAFKILDPELTVVRNNAEWLSKLTFQELIKIASKFTVGQFLQRDNFAKRRERGDPIYVHEFFYAFMQAYDAVALETDAQVGATEQLFILMAGRTLQRAYGQRPQIAVCMPILVGTDGRLRMSKSQGNYIALNDPPEEMYGKVMSLPDDVMMDYYELVTDVPDKELAEIGEALRTRSLNPMEVKMRLAREIVGQFHSAEAAQQAEAEFTRVFREGEVPEQILEFRMSVSRDFMPTPVHSPSWRQIGQPPSEEVLYYLNSIPHILRAAGLVRSISEAMRLIKQGAVERGEAGRFEGIKEQFAPVYDGMIIRVGKRRFLRIVDADKRSQS